MTFVIITGGIDLSVGSVFALGGVLAAWASQWGFLAALLAAAGGLRGDRPAQRGAHRPQRTWRRSSSRWPTLLGARGLLLAITDEGATTYLVPEDAAFAELGQGSVWGFGYPIFIALVLFGPAEWSCSRTRFGQSLFAIGGSSDAATLMGLPVARTKILVYTLSGLLAGLAGALNAA